MKIDKYLSGDDTTPLLLRFCVKGKAESYKAKLKSLSELAEEEKWSNNGETDYSILNNYISKTFEKVAEEDKIDITDDEEYACFNTGLLTPYGEDIFCLFTKSKTAGTLHWYLDGFYPESDWKIVDNFCTLPQVASYFNSDKDLLFNSNATIIINSTHILDDHFEERFPEEIKQLGKTNIINAIKGSLEITKKRIQRNHRIAIPLYYKGKITYLIPVNINDYRIALVVEKIDETRYRANTIFTLEMAYSSARLLMKPEVDWLIEK